MGQKERVLSLEHEGKVYNLRPGDFTALDEMAIYHATGATLLQCFSGGATLFTVAALVWRWRVNHGEDSLAYVDVARTFTFDDIETVTAEPRAGGPPEAPGGGS